MKFEQIEKGSFSQAKMDIPDRFTALHQAFDSKIAAKDGIYQNPFSSFEINLSRWLGLEDVSQVSSIKGNSLNAVKSMYSGTSINGIKTLSLKDIHGWNINPEFKTQNIKQHAGYAAEVIGTTKENLLAQKNGAGILTYRADDLPGLFPKNDQYVDKVRLNAQGEVIETIQTKFVGKNGSDCLSKLVSNKFKKYLMDGKVDKIEIPSDYYDDIRSNDLIGKEISRLESQLERVTTSGKTNVAQKIEDRIIRYQKVDQMLERSTVSQSEAIYAVNHPKRYTAKLFAKDILTTANETGLKSGLAAAGITLAVSTVDNMRSYVSGEISAKEMAKEIAKDTGTAGALGYGTAFVSTSISQAMTKSSCALLKSVGNSCLPAAIVSFAVDSYDAIIDFAQGVIDEAEFVYELGESAASVSGSIAGGALAGAAVGSIAGPAGTVIGIVAGLTGAMIGCVVATEVYATAVRIGADGIELLAEKIDQYAHQAIETVETYMPEKLEEVIAAFNNYAKENNLPISLQNAAD